VKAANHKEPAAPWVINWLTGQINASNGLLDDAITSFELVLSTKIPARKFDFSLDYRVINDLGSALYTRARSEFPVVSATRRDFLHRAIAAYRRTLAVDSEDVGAHWGLAQAYYQAWVDQANGASTTEPDVVVTDGTVDPELLVKQATTIADPKVAALERRRLALRLSRDITRFMNGERPRYQSRLEPLHDVVEILGRAWDAESDRQNQAALARALEVAHRRLHERLKPDETAEGRAFALARQKDRAANHNSESIVIHSLHRPGAPGKSEPIASPATAQSTEQPTNAAATGIASAREYGK
jgi:hypothetical protein